MVMTNDTERLLDETGWELLQALQENARTPYAELGRRVGLTAPAVAERIRRLEATGIITGYHAAVNPARLGLGMTVIMRFQSSRSCEQTLSAVTSCPEVVECHRVSGEDCMTITAVVASVEHLDALITHLSPYGASYTSVVLSSPVHNRPIGPAALLREAESA